ncbi:MAG: PEGA domain-containing protein [Thermoplasmata archaeon]
MRSLRSFEGGIFGFLLLLALIPSTSCIIDWENNTDLSVENASLFRKPGELSETSTGNLTEFLANAYFIDVSAKLGLHLGENNNRTFLYPVCANNSTWLYSLTDQNGVLLTYPHIYDGTNVTNITENVRNVTLPRTPGEVYGVGWNGTHWLIGGTCRDGEGYPYLVSYDGINFTNINLTNSPFGRFTWGAICSVVWNGTHWLIADTEHTLALFDGLNFTNLTPKLEALGWSMPSHWTREQHMSIGWNGTHWLIMVGNASNNATSYKPANIVLWDGAENWTDLTLELNLPVWDIGTYRIAWNGEFWLFGTAESSWDNYGIPSPPDSQVIKFDGRNFYRIGNLFANSTDISDVIWNGKYFLIVGWNHTRNVMGLENYTETQVYLWDGQNAPVEITHRIESDVGYLKAQYALCGGFAALSLDGRCWLIGGVKSQFPHKYALPQILETNVSEEVLLGKERASDVDGGYLVNWTWDICGDKQYGDAKINISEPGIYNCSLTTTDNDAQVFVYNFTVVVHGGWLNGSVHPENATVFVDGIPVSTSSGHFNISLKPGSHTVNVSCAGYSDYNQTVLIGDFAETQMEIVLTPLLEFAVHPFFLMILGIASYLMCCRKWRIALR